ncbi:putative DNA binding domain-containing protein [candidate division WOR-3 bacterium]|nr:putative DNA binding domain-containing protein [candidate division WOR-3 bacterium]
MKRKEIQLIIEEGEGYRIEFKESLSEIEKDLVALANSSGGRIFLGITDKGEIKGIKITNQFTTRVQDIANNCQPKVKVLLKHYENILIVDVREGADKPYKCSAGFFKRIGPISQKMTRNEIIDFIKSEGKIKFDELTVSKFSYLKDFDKKKLLSFLELAGLSKSVKVETILVNLSVAEKQEGRLYFNNTGVLLFAKEPQRFIPWSVFTVALFKDKMGVDVIDRKEITGSLFEIVEQVMDFVKLYSKVAYRFTGKPRRENIYEYPFDAIREAVINSVIHKYYFEHGHNNILRFLPDKIRIENFWVKPKNFKLGETVFRRNPLLVDLFARIHFGEKMGTGLYRMRNICKKENAPYPKIKFNENYFYVTFAPSREYLKMTKEPVAKKELDLNLFNERQRKAIEYITEHGKITNREYRQTTGLGKVYAVKELNELVEKRVFMKVGKGSATHYVLSERSVNDQ